MIVNVREIKGAIDKISEMAKGQKNAPGIMMYVVDDTLALCYYDNHMATVSKIPCKLEDGDVTEKIVFDYNRLVDTVAKCQPSGIISVDSIKFTFVSDDVVKVSADLFMKVADKDGNETSIPKGSKSMDVMYHRISTTTDQKFKLLDRMDYEQIFQPEGKDPDKWDRQYLMDILKDTSFEQGRVIYISSKIQKAYVINKAFTYARAINPKVVTQEQLDELRGRLSEEGRLSEFETLAAEMTKTNTFPIIYTSAFARVASSIMSKMTVNSKDDDVVYMYTKNNGIYIFNGDETTGMYFEGTKGSKVHTGSFERMSGFGYNRFQLNFTREFLADAIKNAVNTSKNDKLAFTFEEKNPGQFVMKIAVQNTGASVSDTYEVDVEGQPVDMTGNLKNTTVTVSLKPFYDMLSQLNTPIVAMDISEEVNGQVCMRLAEVNIDKVQKEWAAARVELGLPLAPVDDQPMPETPIEVKLAYREKTFDICQYSMISTLTK